MRYFRTSERSFLLSVKLSICKGCVCFSKEIAPIFTLKYNISVFRTPSVFSRFLHHFLAFRHKLTRFSASFLSFFGTICPFFEVIVKAGSSRRTTKTMIISFFKKHPLQFYSFTVVYFHITIPRWKHKEKFYYIYIITYFLYYFSSIREVIFIFCKTVNL